MGAREGARARAKVPPGGASPPPARLPPCTHRAFVDAREEMGFALCCARAPGVCLPLTAAGPVFLCALAAHGVCVCTAPVFPPAAQGCDRGRAAFPAIDSRPVRPRQKIHKLEQMAIRDADGVELWRGPLGQDTSKCCDGGLAVLPASGVPCADGAITATAAGYKIEKSIDGIALIEGYDGEEPAATVPSTVP